jgi:hypothetical protein
MPRPGLATLLEPYGNFTPMGVLWSQVGVSQPYEILLGTAELLAGILLFIPRTATVGAMLGLVSMAQVFVLNMTFDVPVKILSGHLMLMCLVLLAPEARRLVQVLVLNRPAGPSTTPYPFHTTKTRTIVTLLQVADPDDALRVACLERIRRRPTAASAVRHLVGIGVHS